LLKIAPLTSEAQSRSSADKEPDIAFIARVIRCAAGRLESGLVAYPQHVWKTYIFLKADDPPP